MEDNDGKGNNDDEGNDDDNAAMDIDTSNLVVDTKFLEPLCLEDAYQGVLTEAKKAIENMVL
ncbi:hypothetical protein C0995_007805, partial [Termitomyces sp. Mi166